MPARSSPERASSVDGDEAPGGLQKFGAALDADEEGRAARASAEPQAFYARKVAECPVIRNPDGSVQLLRMEDILEVCQHRIHHDPHHVSADGDFSWEEVECLGACVNAPMVLIGKDTYEDLTPESFEKVLDGFAKGKPVKPGPQVDRQFSAPIGGATTLTDPAIYASAPTRGQPGTTDADAKRPGAAANVTEAPAPKPPAGDASATRKPKPN